MVDLIWSSHTNLWLQTIWCKLHVSSQFEYQETSNVLICFRPHISRITHYSFVQRVSFVKLLNKILSQCIPIPNSMCFRAQDSWWQRFELSILQLLVYSMCHNHMDSYHIYDSCLQYDLIQASSISQSFSILISAIHNCQVKTKSYPNAFFIDHNWIDMLGPLAIFYTLWIHLSTYLWPKWFRKWWSFSWCKKHFLFQSNCMKT